MILDCSFLVTPTASAHHNYAHGAEQVAASAHRDAEHAVQGITGEVPSHEAARAENLELNGCGYGVPKPHGQPRDPDNGDVAAAAEKASRDDVALVWVGAANYATRAPIDVGGNPWWAWEEIGCVSGVLVCP